MTTNIPPPNPMPYTAAGSADYLRHTEFDVSPTHRNRLASIVSMLASCGSEPRNVRVLEIGCGVGNICIPVASLGYSVTAGDIHLPSVEKARAKNSFSNLTFLNEPLERMQIGEFDVIILTEVLEHVGAYRWMLDTISRAMKPGARLILTVPNGASRSERLLRPSYFIKRLPVGRHFVKLVKRVLGGRDLTTANEQTPHINFFTLPALSKLFDKCGLRAVTFHSMFLGWILHETFFGTDERSDLRAAPDFARSQRASPERCGFWSFLLVK